MTVAEAVRQIGVTQQTFYRRCKLYGGMGRSQQKQLKNLEKENQRLGGSDLDENAGSVLSDNQHPHDTNRTLVDHVVNDGYESDLPF